MFAAAVIWAKANPLLAKLAGAGAVVALVLALALGLYLKGRADKGADVKQAAAKAEAKLDVADARADAGADIQRATDTAAVAAQTKDLQHAYENVPDSRPSDVRRRLNCQRLRNAGYDLAKVPACSGPDAGGQAHPAR